MHNFHRTLTVLLALGLCFTGPIASGRPYVATTGSPTRDTVAPDPDVCTRPDTSCTDPELSMSTGVAFHVWAYDSRADMTRALDMIAQAGIRWVRIDLPWGELFPTPDRVDADFASDIDYATSRATQDGMRVLAVLLDTPPWAARGNTGASPPKDAADFGVYAGWVAATYGNNVDAYEIWNEPNSTGFFTGSVADYADLLQAAYAQIKQWDLLGNTVVLGGLTYSDSEWLSQLYETSDTVSLYFDVVGVHPYPSPSDMAPECPPTTMWRVTAIDRVRDTMLRFNDALTPMWITELGWSSHGNVLGTPNWQLGVSEQEQADFAVRALDLIATHFPYVKKTFWYEASDTAVEYSDVHTYLHENNFGLLHRDLTPKPAYAAVHDYVTNGSVPPPQSGDCD